MSRPTFDLSPAPHAPKSQTAPPIVQDVLGSPGRPLEPALRGQMEASFGHDFSRVRVHTDTRAGESARAVGARAYTVGSDVVLGTGGQGRETLAHELAHVVQQSGAGATSGTLPIAAPGGRHEQEAEAAAKTAGRAAALGGAVSGPLGSSALGVARQSSADKPLDFELQTTMSNVLTHLRPPLRSKEADNVIAVLAWYRETHPDDAFFTVVSHRDEIYLLLAPWAFNPAFVGGIRPEGAPGPSELLDSFDRALASWKADDERTRVVRRSRTPQIAGFYVREVTAFEREYEASQLVTEELPGGGVYTGSRGGVVAARQRAEAQIILGKMEAVGQAGPIATLGRVFGATGAWLGGGDVQAGGERGAALGSFGDVLLPFAARGRPSTAAEESPGRPRPAIVEKAPPRVPMPTPDVPAPPPRATTQAALARTVPAEAFARTAPPEALARTAPPEALARTAPPEALARTAPPEALARTAPPEALARTAPPPPRAPAPAASAPAAAPQAPGRATQPAAAPTAPSRASTGRAQAPAVSAEDVIAQYRRDPKSVFAASTDWFKQGLAAERTYDPRSRRAVGVPRLTLEETGELPLAVRSGDHVIVDRDRWPDHLRTAIGLPPRSGTP
jgi:hypothetical protein